MHVSTWRQLVEPGADRLVRVQASGLFVVGEGGYGLSW